MIQYPELGWNCYFEAIILGMGVYSAVGGCAGWRVRSIPSTQFEFSAHANQAFDPSRVGKFVPDSFWQWKTPTCVSAGHPQLFCGSKTHSKCGMVVNFKVLVRNPFEIERLAHPKRDRLTPSFIFSKLLISYHKQFLTHDDCFMSNGNISLRRWPIM